jgi:hypothetical protein
MDFLTADYTASFNSVFIKQPTEEQVCPPNPKLTENLPVRPISLMSSVIMGLRRMTLKSERRCGRRIGCQIHKKGNNAKNNIIF